jgi:hypothetical protein
MGTNVRSRAQALLAKGETRTVYRVQRLALALFHRRWQLPLDGFREKDILAFVHRPPPGRGAGETLFLTGLSEIGLISSGHRPQLWENTSQTRIARLLEGICGEYLCAIGAFAESR